MKDAKRRNAVARVLAAENKTQQVAAEAKRLNIHTRTIERWVAAAQVAGGDAGQPAVSENATPQEKTPENPVLDKLLKEEGAAPDAGKGPITTQELQKGVADMEAFCVDGYNGMKSAIGAVLVSVRYTPPLDASSPEVLSKLKAGFAVETAIRLNAPKLYPVLVKYASNWGALIGAVAIDAFSMVMALEGLAKSKGWTEPEKKGQAAAGKPQVPTPQQYGEQLRPAPKPDAPPAAAAAPPAARQLIVDAPLAAVA